MRIGLIPRTRWGLIRMIALAGILPLLFLIIWLFTVRMPGPAFSGPLPPLTPDQELIRAALDRHVRALAHDIGVRSDKTYSNVLQASAYIERRLQDLGYTVDSQEFFALGRSYRNIEATLPGAPGHAHEVVVLGAHYDTAEDAPGADDNASGVAGVPELAATLAHGTLPTQGAAAPAWVPGVWWSDHWSFWREGYPAIMITDTAPYRNPFYHTPQDTPDKLDYARMARVVHGLTHVVRELAGR